ncbi:hypothetical protein ARALYDRAFT_891348 [Arabidopsis lyrata subsp. lyrata]|uniref:Dehydrogenase E1 component domain-containing protein n=1 Tax=Arabidopsis lyrata subsp. lyrata TaxID=81972 RepID=D7KNM6_ARALL|nr:hypothetical protein ARALYDRAFT_891348 [Arabidopsis lyrata subsp. lyrata]
MATAFTPTMLTKGLELYEDMILGRSVEDMCAQIYYREKMFGFVHLYNGHEGDMCLVLVEDMCAHLYIRDHVHSHPRCLCSCCYESIRL